MFSFAHGIAGKGNINNVGPDFTIVVMPDTQNYVVSNQDAFSEQIDWIIANEESSNIVFVAHEGDLVDNFNAGTREAEWDFAKAQMDRLGTAGIPYSVTVGNHDYDPSSGRGTVNYDLHFPLSDFSSMGTYGGAYDTGSENTYHLLNLSGGIKIGIITLEFGPRDAVITWANSIVATYPSYVFMYVSHAHVHEDDTYLISSDTGAPSNGYGLGTDVNNGDEVWANFITLNPNVTLAMCGHRGSPTDGTGEVTDDNDYAVTVHQYMSNYQYTNNYLGTNITGDGYFRIMTFKPSENKIENTTYSPREANYLTDAGNQFDITGFSFAATLP